MQLKHQRVKRRPGSLRVGSLLALCVAAAGLACTRPPTTEAAPLPPRPPAEPRVVRSDATVRSLTIQTRQVTAADVAATPDGKTLVFSALGHLFRISSKGGDAEQLTFGPFVDSEPSVSPEGSRVAFSSNRSGSVSSIYLLNLTTGQLDALTTEHWAGRPAWSPDGRQLAYLSYQPEGPQAALEWVGPGSLTSSVRQLDLATDRVTTLATGYVQDVAYLDDGRLLWSRLTPAKTGFGATTQLLASDGSSEPAIQLHTTGVIDSLEADPDSTAVFLRKFEQRGLRRLMPQPESLLKISLPGGQPVVVTEIDSVHPRPTFGAADGHLWFGERGALWRVAVESGTRTPLPISLKATLEVLPKTQPVSFSVSQPPGAPTILSPRLLPDDGGVLFSAGGYLWRQAPGKPNAQRLFDNDGFEWGPAAASPDGKRVAYQLSEGRHQELRVAWLDGSRSISLAKSERTGPFQPAWHPAGTHLAYTGYEGELPYVHIVDLGTGKRFTLRATAGSEPGPHFSADGRWLCFTAEGQLQKADWTGTAPPLALTALAGLTRARMTPDGSSLVFARDDEIWWAPLGEAPVTKASIKRLSPRGGTSFGFSPDGQSLVYSAGGQVWQRPLRGEGKQVLATALPPPPAVRPLLLRNVRPLALEHGRFLEPTSIYLDKGRIQWVGSEAAHEIPATSQVVDAAGRFAMPGLIDMLGYASPRAANGQRIGSGGRVAHLEGYIAYGVTTVRMATHDLPLLLSWIDRRALGAPAPRLLPSLTPRFGSMKTAEFLQDPLDISDEDLRRWLANAKHRGALGVLQTTQLPWRTRRALAGRALELGLEVSTQTYTSKQAIQAAILGHWNIQHLAPSTLWKDDLLGLLAATRTHWTSTVSMLGGNHLLFDRQPALVQTPLFVRFAQPRGGDPDHASRALGDQPDAGFRALLETVKQAHLSGVRLLPGGGAPTPDTAYGHSLHTELRHLVDAGIPTHEVLKLATASAAEALGGREDLGTLAAGKVADLVLLRDNPLENIRNTLSISHVIAGGRIFVDGKPYAGDQP